MFLAFEAGAVKEGSGVLGRAITACAIKACVLKACAIRACVVKASSESCHQGGCGFLKQVKGASTSLRFHIVAGRAVTELVVLGLSVPTGMSDQDSLQQGQI